MSRRGERITPEQWDKFGRLVHVGGNSRVADVPPADGLLALIAYLNSEMRRQGKTDAEIDATINRMFPRQDPDE